MIFNFNSENRFYISNIFLLWIQLDRSFGLQKLRVRSNALIKTISWPITMVEKTTAESIIRVTRTLARSYDLKKWQTDHTDYDNYS